MAITANVVEIGLYCAAEDLTDHQWRAVQLNDFNDKPMWQKPSGLGVGVPQGVLSNTPRVNQSCSVIISGIAKAVVGGSSFIKAGRPVGVLEDGTIVEGGTFASTVDSGEPGTIISILLSGGGFTSSNFSYVDIPSDPPILIPLGQAMNVHGGDLCINGDLYLDGDLYIED